MKKSTPLMLLIALLVSFNAQSTPTLSSLPSAPATIYLDFDGYYVNTPVWNSGVPFYAESPGMSDSAVTEIFNRVSEDYRPFSVDITTDSMVYYAAPATQRIRVVVTSTSAWYPGVGGITFVGSFTWGDETPCFVFADLLGPNNPKMVAECCSHESGHSLGLYHQSTYDSTCTLVDVYNGGVGTGEISWAPIMGDSYYMNMTGWNNGPMPYGCTVPQDNLSVITTANGFTYRPDDYGDDINSDPTVLDVSSESLNVNGIISTNTDQDAFKFTVPQDEHFLLNANPYSVGSNDDGADLDINVQLYDQSKNLIGTYTSPTAMSTSIDTFLNAGDYYMVVNGTGNMYTTNYGSLGSYTLSGKFITNGILPIQGVTLTGIIDNNQHDLSWKIIASETIQSVLVQYSTDGINFTNLEVETAASTGYNYTPFQKSSTVYYRLKVTGTSGQTMYSNTIKLGSNGNNASLFNVSTLVVNDITINAPQNFEYRLNDINGRLVAKGSGTEGYNKVNMGNEASGIYILQLLSNNKQEVERIIKQ